MVNGGSLSIRYSPLTIRSFLFRCLQDRDWRTTYQWFCQKDATNRGGGSLRSGVSVGRSSRSKIVNMRRRVPEVVGWVKASGL
jgi:hypothetical protein